MQVIYSISDIQLLSKKQQTMAKQIQTNVNIIVKFLSLKKNEETCICWYINNFYLKTYVG